MQYGGLVPTALWWMGETPTRLDLWKRTCAHNDHVQLVAAMLNSNRFIVLDHIAVPCLKHHTVQMHVAQGVQGRTHCMESKA
jgi:hypothetical protein